MLSFLSRRKPTPHPTQPAFPTQQLLILGKPSSDNHACSLPVYTGPDVRIPALCRICEPIAFMSIFPYVYFMIASFDITSDNRQISVYAGMVTSAFAFAEFSSGALWGRLSDIIGRKPVLLTGLAGTGLSMIVFGFAPSLPVALLARALGGLLNGSVCFTARGLASRASLIKLAQKYRSHTHHRRRGRHGQGTST